MRPPPDAFAEARSFLMDRRIDIYASATGICINLEAEAPFKFDIDAREARAMCAVLSELADQLDRQKAGAR